jgi:hypothetical protein
MSRDWAANGAGAAPCLRPARDLSRVSRLACAAVICVLAAVGVGAGVAHASTPLAWTATDVDATNPLAGVSCPSTSLCVAVDGAGNVVTSTNPTGGGAAWTVTDVDRKKTLAGG